MAYLLVCLRSFTIREGNFFLKASFPLGILITLIGSNWNILVSYTYSKTVFFLFPVI